MSNQHLLSNHREIKRIPNCIIKGRYKLPTKALQYTMGVGHVAFFYDKIAYLDERYHELYDECISRGYNVTYYGDVFKQLTDDKYKHLVNHWTPTKKDLNVCRTRIAEKICSKIYKGERFYTFRGNIE
jgi:hypothetical protein